MGGNDRGQGISAVCAALVTIGIIVTALRTYVRAWLKKKFGWDDAFMIVTLVSHRFPPYRNTYSIPPATEQTSWDRKGARDK